ncbi:MAG: hypothetical protein J0I47_04175 [Sphingomonas sp.]|uniref:hypothetical protein n=1 Tax=Sphingomonas sp. TaxID=28214 RepID=UPI001AD23B34|nr:hypothetical protein [Sphingomonas sp.]MBN8807422.1 hypothetical protein [Sphingomonas sp.]
MMMLAILTFAGAFAAAAFVIYATVTPSLDKIRLALSGQGVASILPPLPPRRASTLRVTPSRPALAPSYWRAAA